MGPRSQGVDGMAVLGEQIGSGCTSELGSERHTALSEFRMKWIAAFHWTVKTRSATVVHTVPVRSTTAPAIRRNALEETEV
jgi:hypothetical protein